MKNTVKINDGRVLLEGFVNGEKFVVIATRDSKNQKTGPMIQIWIILANSHPVPAQRAALDASTICQGCPLAAGNGCYVAVHQAPAQIWNRYQKGKYLPLQKKDYRRFFTFQKVRFGAYGNPSLIPLPMVEEIAKLSSGWTGYFHDWHLMKPTDAQAYGRYFMASTGTPDSLIQANALQLRTFHCSEEKPATHIQCPEGTSGIQCYQCLLCQGTSKKAKPIWVAPHGNKLAKAKEAIK